MWPLFICYDLEHDMEALLHHGHRLATPAGCYRLCFDLANFDHRTLVFLFNGATVVIITQSCALQQPP